MPELQNDIGHGKETWPVLRSKGVGASGGVPGMAEHDFNSAVGIETKRLLKGKISSYEAQPANSNDVSLIRRTNLYNARYASKKDSIGMSHHGNAGASATRGFGVFYWHDHAPSKKLAEIVLAEYKAEFPDLPIWATGLWPCIPDTWSEFHMTKATKAPFVLIEWEFFTNNAARKLMLSSNYRKRCGLVAARSACRWYGIKFEDQPAKKVVVEKVKPNPIYSLDKADRIGTVVIGKEPMNYRTEPNIKAPILKELPAGLGSDPKSPVHLYEIKGEWLRLGTGWISNADNAYAKVTLYPKKPTPPKEEAKKESIKEEKKLLNVAIVVNSFADMPAVHKLSIRLGCGIYFREAVKTKEAKELIIAGGGVKGLDKFADKITDLSGATRKLTDDNVDAYMKKLK
ncbi:N-acetylmuramoyl-L-alanine amidase [Jeotgalibacillus sp. S-D1]|uniref:N-acetylmuramoyl-L-alanine amidase family protein n=1 Tax=Jeotgalibacillus sp. S-D1 TaxID=2552189 RepID=UPI00105921BC|nr:N-acetylmuramoyl-L-alanine amidase [Jeotgalibacillus sp. S-D1]TDL34589.1 N-acetylmuramoyl-L-alanine amidase [Jeotgalibacillus sp. S-D1]